MMRGRERLVVRMTARVWNGIDASMDNRAQSAMSAYWDAGGDMGDPRDPEVGPQARVAIAIRQQGWAQIDDAWLRPVDEVLCVALSVDHWRFVLATARHDLPLYQDLARTAVGSSKREMDESAELCRLTIEVVERALAAGS